MCYDEMNVSIQKLQENGLSALSKMLKTLNVQLCPPHPPPK